jgi:hypothetical protein
VLGESLLRYESLAGYPLQMRQKILDYLVTDLHLLFPEHLSALLDDEFTSLDLSGLVSSRSLGGSSSSSSKANKTRDEHITQVGHLCPRLKEINLSRAVRITNFSLSESIAKCLQVRVVCRVSCVVCRVSCVVCRVSCVVCRVSCVVCRVSCVVCRGLTEILPSFPHS